nr:immunoglobulin heavy chain junction region [Macaca mulatta]MOY22291.1 immunoglobulin heavy chain junction region [Macaca mulatta]MOY23194.1 immunoglobulin heavy chain junction region [Macaca mulatta]MOY23906.1 immunoglobulin heavy chain junction region [Macaca mulatta]MOY24549.1 immunoglobulin heavy chain junction region [Macaca mulatta]
CARQGVDYYSGTYSPLDVW